MSRRISPCLVKLSRPTVIELNVQLVLEDKSTRQEQKLQSLTKYIQRYPSGWKKRLELADLLYQKGDWEKAIAQYYQVIARQPQLVDIRLKLAKLLQLATRNSEAIAIYQETISFCSNPATKSHIQGLIAICHGQRKSAIAYFKSAIATEPQNPAHCLILGKVYLELKNPTAALAAFQEILLLKPHDLIALIHSHDALLVLGKFAEADALLTQAQELAPNDYAVLKRCLASRLRQKLVLAQEGKQTKKMVTVLLNIAPNSADAHQLKADYYRLRQEESKTVAVWQKFTQAHPNNIQGWQCYAKCLAKMGNIQAAAKIRQQAQQLLQG